MMCSRDEKLRLFDDIVYTLRSFYQYSNLATEERNQIIVDILEYLLHDARISQSTSALWEKWSAQVGFRKIA